MTIVPLREGSKELAHVLRWRDAVTRAWQSGCLSDADALHLLVLVQFADRDGRLKRKGDAPTTWWYEEQLAGFLRMKSPKTFRARWRNWQEAGWVGSNKPRWPILPTERWLAIPTLADRNEARDDG